jgi:hypothetical protein
MIKLLRDYKKFTSNIGNEPLFNLSCFLMTKESKDKLFFTDFTQGQNFRQFLQSSFNSKQNIVYFEYLSMHFNMMMDDQDTFGRCKTENNLTARDSFSGFFKSKPKPLNLLTKFFATLDYLPTSFSQDIKLQDKNDEYILTPYFINRNSMPDFMKVENLARSNSSSISNRPDVMLFDKLPEFNVHEDTPEDVRMYNLQDKQVKKTKTKLGFKKKLTTRKTFKIKDIEEEYLDLKKSGSTRVSSSRLGCKLIYFYK